MSFGSFIFGALITKNDYPVLFSVISIENTGTGVVNSGKGIKLENPKKANKQALAEGARKSMAAVSVEPTVNSQQ